MKITFLGGGNMASALIGGLLNNGIPPSEIAVIEINAENRARLEREFRVRCYAEPDPVSMLATRWCWRSSRSRCATPALGQEVPEPQLVISIAAGLRLGDLSRWLGGHDRWCAPCRTRRR
jgi:pyrroline-5-carboxylate reductase